MTRTRIIALAAVLAACAGARDARAQSGADKAAAEDLFRAAKSLADAGNHAGACPKFELSQRLDPGIGTLLYLADCYEKTGRYASAWATFLEAAAAARAAGQADREQLARELAGALEPKLSKLAIVVEATSDVPGLQVTRDGAPVDRGLWGIASPVDAGPRRIEAKAPGKLTWSSVVDVKGTQPVSVSVPPLADAPVTPAGPAPAPVAATAPAGAVTPAPAEADRGSGQRTLGYVVGGLGVVGLGVGAVFGLQAKSKNDEADSHCGKDGLCDDEGVTLGEDALAAATLSTIAFGIGAAGVVGGLVLIVTAPSGPERAGAATPATVALRGTW